MWKFGFPAWVSLLALHHSLKKAPVQGLFFNYFFIYSHITLTAVWWIVFG